MLSSEIGECKNKKVKMGKRVSLELLKKRNVPLCTSTSLQVLHRLCG